MYLSSTYVLGREQLFIRSLESSLAPGQRPCLARFFLSKVDRAISDHLGKMTVDAFHYVDGYLIFVNKGGPEDRVLDAQKDFKESALCLNFTVEVPHENELQFLDIRVRFEVAHTCLNFHPVSMKAPLSFSSGHSKTARNGIVLSRIGPALLKSWVHAVAESVESEVIRLNTAGYPSSVVAAACEKFIKKDRCSVTASSRENNEERKRYAV